MVLKIKVGQGRPDLRLRTSEYLSEYFLGAVAPAWGLETKHEERAVAVVEEVIESLEGLATTGAANVHDFLKKNVAAWGWTVDWCYCKQALEAIPEATERFLKLSPVLSGRTTSVAVNSYLREATRCYLWGFFQASVALLRAALETGLNERLEKGLSAVPQAELFEKINQAARFKMISAESQGFAHDVRKAANEVLHEKSIPEQDVFDLLIKTRHILLECVDE